MKNQANQVILLSIVGGFLFNFLFWGNGSSVNLLIYSVFIIAINCCNNEAVKTLKFKLYALAHLFAAILVIINHSDLSLTAYYFSMVIFIGFSHTQHIRSVLTALWIGLVHFFTLPISFIQTALKITIGNYNLHPLKKLIKYVLLPCFIVFIFTILYSLANSIFAKFIEDMLQQLADSFTAVLNFFFKNLTIGQFMHFIFGIGVTGALIIVYQDKNIENAECKQQEKHLRKRLNRKQNNPWYEMAFIFAGNLLTRNLALKTEYITAIVSFTALNVMLLFLNGIDISTVWFNYQPSDGYSAELHNGTNVLIFSIVLAMMVILYFFRANLNFYSKNKLLRQLVYAWIIQNCILVISVVIRDGYYIDQNGLTYKRIGVLVFATLCFVGLATVYLKVQQQKTLFYLLKVNGNIWYALLLAFSVINWDVAIVKYNIAQMDSSNIDCNHLLSLSNKTLPILDQNRVKFNIASKPNQETFLKRLDNRIDGFKNSYEVRNWLGWNLQDWRTAEYFGISK
ncbi:DUF4153 domain-containing protein [Pedobacter sp. MW01-1-1]|uniref:DUF4153 domain-containing protein n=1 Tax=Pedobacter sp. MW01-1-1 TaxID=3383027 RepID=UPI003FEDE4FC